ncbi:triphosphoribosyl-dephospho-CoA synthase CitG [Streptococcus merionis]|uniref:triphosphoribosyl-dephospho-CoA synthase CitG n=1 Tax=Streptococcus merionis TaxID=400065 RepID=UPI0026F2DEC3|nr:triphosphoribosyl-dephospho-CoA synthase CitG [Streptococcus merionis]
MAKLTSETIVTLATKSLLYEVSLSPKPGLVDRYNNGSHHDMDFNLFLDSSMSLLPFFKAYLEAGLKHDAPLPLLFDKARTIGIEAEKAMFTATKGTNTHKGANFSFALILAALGYFLKHHPQHDVLTAENSEAVLTSIADMCYVSVMADFDAIAGKRQLSYGEKLYVNHGLMGIRGEAASGYKSVRKLLLPALRKNLKLYSTEEAFLRTMVLLMSQIEDGNLIHRGGIEVWQQVQTECQTVLTKNLSSQDFYQWLKDYDQLLIERHLSPGGTADLLALGYFFMQLEGVI